jgi:hypothetical protein
MHSAAGGDWLLQYNADTRYDVHLQTLAQHFCHSFDASIEYARAKEKTVYSEQMVDSRQKATVDSTLWYAPSSVICMI